MQFILPFYAFLLFDLIVFSFYFVPMNSYYSVFHPLLGLSRVNAIKSLSKMQVIVRHAYRIRQHTNPLAQRNQKPLIIDDNWLYQVFPSPLNPLVINIGCAKGGWDIEMATKHPNLNILGLEVRDSAVELCEQRKKSSQVTNAQFYKSNANVDLQRILSSLQEIMQKENILHDPSKNLLHMITIQFPDPCFKKKHQKRRVVNQSFMEILSKYSYPDITHFFIQSDVAEVMEDIMNHIHQSNCFDPVSPYSIQTTRENPNYFSIATEREISCLRRGLPIYRMLYRRNQNPYIPPPLSSDPVQTQDQEEEGGEGNGRVPVPSSS
jgi:tRNA (guanine-N7-)-methyltransferase